MELVSRNEMIKAFRRCMSKSFYTKAGRSVLINVVNDEFADIPIAYDVNEVIKRFEMQKTDVSTCETKEDYEASMEWNRIIDKFIDIVKGGGIE